MHIYDSISYHLTVTSHETNCQTMALLLMCACNMIIIALIANYAVFPWCQLQYDKYR